MVRGGDDRGFRVLYTRGGGDPRPIIITIIIITVVVVCGTDTRSSPELEKDVKFLESSLSFSGPSMGTTRYSSGEREAPVGSPGSFGRTGGTRTVVRLK